MSSIFVDYEYGKLKEAVVGIANVSHPDITVNWMKEELENLSVSEREMAIKRSGRMNSDIIDKNGKTNFELLEEENENLIKILEKYNINIHRPNPLNSKFLKESLGEELLKSGYTQQFSRDPFIVIGNSLIELSMSKPVRKCEIFGYNKLLYNDILKNNRGKIISMPKSPYLEVTNSMYPVLEGGDIMVLGRKILIGNSNGHNQRSNENGYIWLKNFLGNEYDVIKIDLKQSVLHLDCAISFPKEGLAILSRDSFESDISDIIKGLDIIDVSLEEANQGFACNGFPIDKNHYILSYNDKFNNKRIEEELIKRGIKVEKIYFQTHNNDGGSVRCTCNSLVRTLS